MNPIYIVDDEPSICEILESIFQDEGYSVVSFSSAETFLEKMEEQKPSLVLLDIWLPGADGMQVLKTLRTQHEEVRVIMMSGHAGIDSAVVAMKEGAYDFLEKPLHLEALLDKVSCALKSKSKLIQPELPSDIRMETATYDEDLSSAGMVTLETTKRRQKTLQRNVVLQGTGLLSGRNTGIILSPLEENSGIIYQSLDGTSIPGVITSLENFVQSKNSHSFSANSTVLMNQGKRVRTVEHLMAVLSMMEIDNALIKVDEEIPNIDGSATDFCRLIAEAGIVEQEAFAKKAVVQKKIGIGKEEMDTKHLYIEPSDTFSVTMRVNYPAPIFEQQFTFNPSLQSFEKEIAPARSFNTFENIDMAQKLGKVRGGYLNSHIILHEGKVINTELRYPDEFVRHKILDLIGDLYLLGYLVQGHIFANMTSHGYNQALVQKLYFAMNSPRV